MVKPRKQDALIALLKQNTNTAVRTLPGWKTTRLIAAKDGAGVVIGFLVRVSHRVNNRPLPAWKKSESMAPWIEVICSA
jgi:antibiotic biosynthesis monooxygenase (ABM) superfamily enzyme